MINRSMTRKIPHFPVALDEVAILFGTLVAETILASVHVRAPKQAGHMNASDLIKALQTPCKEGAVRIWKMSARPLPGGIRPPTEPALSRRRPMLERMRAAAVSRERRTLRASEPRADVARDDPISGKLTPDFVR